jgi:hypothetical protein
VHPCADGEYFRRTDGEQNCGAGACWTCAGGVYRQVAAPYRAESYVVKQLLEAKSLMNAEISGNVFENSWGASLAPAMQLANDGEFWVRGENILVRNNIIRNCAGGMHTASGGPQFASPVRNVRVVNNLFYDYGETATPSFRFPGIWPVMFSRACVDCALEHNTVLSGVSGGAAVGFVGGPLTRFRMADNILHGNQYGILGDGRGSDCPAVEYYTGTSALTHNILINNSGRRENGEIGPCARQTKYIAPATDLFVGQGNYRLRPTSPYSASCSRRCDFKATDGKDLGADIDEVEAATSGAIAGTPPWAEQARVAVQPSARGAAVDYQAPGDGACSLKLYTNAARTAIDADTATPEQQADSRPGNSNAGRQRRFLLGAIVPLKPQTAYWYLLICGDRKIPGHFQTLPAAR